MAEEEKKPEEPKASKPKDGTFQIIVSADKMQASLEITAPEDGGSPVSVDAVTEKLSAMGIKPSDLQSVLTFIKSGNFGAAHPLASGQPPVNGVDGSVELLYMEKVREKKQASAQGNVDHREFSSLIFAKDGELLAKRLPPTPGQDGMNVLGTPVKAVPGKEAPLTAGENIRTASDGTEYFAARAGQIKMEGSVLSVEAVLVCEGNVDFDVGNIDFDGSVTVGGAITEGFTVKATMDVTVQTISKANVDAGRNVIVEKGIIGSADTSVKAKGRVTVKFIENANVTAGENVVVTETILHSNISAAKHVVLRGGKHSSIVGGHVRAGGCVEARNIGTEAGTKTNVEIGMDPALREQMAHLQHEIDKISEAAGKIAVELATLTKLKERIRNLPPAKETRMTELKAMADKLAPALRSLQSQLAALQQKTAGSALGFISVKEKIFPGTHLTVLDQIMNVNKPQGPVRFYLNREKKEIGTSDFKEVEI